MDTAAEAFIDISSTGSHTHSGTNDGGGLIDIFSANPHLPILALYLCIIPTKPRWVEIVTSTGSTTNDTDGSTGEFRLNFATGATSGAAATYPLKGLYLISLNVLVSNSKQG